MRFQTKQILSVLLIFLSLFAIKAQEPKSSPTPPIAVDEDETGCGLITELINIHVLVWSSKKGYLNDLTYKDFVVYDEKIKQEIEFFIFDELTNQYIIAFYPKDFIPDNKWREIKVKVKLSAEKKKEYGKIFVSGQNGYYPKVVE